MRTFAALALIFALAAPGLALAQRDPAPPLSRVTVVDFDGDLLEVELKRPEGTVVTHRPPTKFPSLLELRKDFHDELMASISEL